tara:strand:+ start:326 stop:517 length:192 start_codon:yes stop_codon:yes gene_type:complete
MKNKLSLQTRKSLEVNIGEKAAYEIYELINNMSEEISNLKRNKVDVTRIVPVSPDPERSSNII